MIWIFKENSFEAFENNGRVTTPLALWRGVGGEAFYSVLMLSIGFFSAMRWVCR